ncbi:MAG TPA: hypothetical protein VE968_03575 [Sphingomicrobium sp.]|nr:hypothetical protein [Sphingomicrobium sp.]
MAYLARIEPGDEKALSAPAPTGSKGQEPRFSDLEWSVIRLARLDRLWTLRTPTRLSRFFRRLVGRNPNPALANPRLETLRRIAVLSWHFGFTVPGDDISEFLRAGFSLEQYELLVSTVRGMAAKRSTFSKAGLA